MLLLPPCNSDDNPIDELWSHLEARHRRTAARTRKGLCEAVGEALEGVTQRRILGWFNHGGRYATHS